MSYRGQPTSSLSISQSFFLTILDSYMLCLSHEELMQRAKWDGAAGTSRQQLLNAIIGPSVWLERTET